jgi:hypothetical protein
VKVPATPSGVKCKWYVVPLVAFYNVYVWFGFDGGCGVVVRIIAYYARVRGFDSRTVQTFVSMNMSVCIRSGCFYV